MFNNFPNLGNTNYIYGKSLLCLRYKQIKTAGWEPAIKEFFCVSVNCRYCV